MNEADHTHPDPYRGLLRHVPEVLQGKLTRAVDARRGLEWTVQGELPDPQCPGGVNPRRLHLQAVHADPAQNERWVTFDGEECVTENLEDDCEIACGHTVGGPKVVESGLGGRQSLARVTDGDREPTEEEEYELYLLEGALIVVTEHDGLCSEEVYLGLYRLEEPHREQGYPPRIGDHRCWLNLQAERLLRRELTTRE